MSTFLLRPLHYGFIAQLCLLFSLCGCASDGNVYKLNGITDNSTARLLEIYSVSYNGSIEICIMPPLSLFCLID